MQANIQTDAIDAKILTALGEDGRRSYAEVGAEVGLSTAAVHERVTGTPGSHDEVLRAIKCGKCLLAYARKRR